jgi:manganese oxidase
MENSFRGGLAPVLIRAVAAALLVTGSPLPAQTLPPILANDNRTPAGVLRDGVLYLKLELRKGIWHPEAEDGEAIPAYALGEAAKPLQVPAPAIRVPQGTALDISIHSSLEVPATLYGLHRRPGSDRGGITVDPGATRHVRFEAGLPGTYLYWGRTPDGGRNNGRLLDALLGGALVVDPPGGNPQSDRIFVLERWNGPTRTAINGKSWPYTERLNFKVGEKVQWKIVNASDLSHPMHLHGFHFSLEGEGDGDKYRIFDDGMKPEEFTHSVETMQTFAMSWTPKEPGRWLYHCHRIPHMRLPVPLDPKDAILPAVNHEHQHMHDMDSPYSGMGGMILGITVSGRPAIDTVTGWTPARRLEMRVGNRKGDARFYEIALKDLPSGKEARSTGLTGPVLVVNQGEKTEIAITNTMREPTSIHWHGLEIESYYDGVPGWGGIDEKRTPAVEPGKTFVVRMIPQRAGSFMYHTHWHDEAQLTGGVHGAMIVMPAGQAYDPAADKSFLMSLGPNEPFGSGMLLMNGEPQPAALTLRAGSTYRFRFMNITPTMDFMRINGSGGVARGGQGRGECKGPEAAKGGSADRRGGDVRFRVPGGWRGRVAPGRMVAGRRQARRPDTALHGAVNGEARPRGGSVEDTMQNWFDWQLALHHLGLLAGAYALALPIGWEREKAGRSAGLRTFPLVAMASCAYVLIASSFPGSSPESRARVIQGVITGMGFIGGGAILRQRDTVTGTATAASLWNTGAIGVAMALSRFEIALLLAALNYATLRLLTPLKKERQESGVEEDDKVEG